MHKLTNSQQQLAFACTKRVREHYLKNDLAHRLDHAHQVMRDAVEIAHLVTAQHLIPKLIVAAYYHDIHRANAENHHILAYDEVFSDKQFIIRVGGAETDEDIHDIALACMEHRGSWDGEYSGILSEIISAADRGSPEKITLNDRMRRSYLYARDSLGMSHLSAQLHAGRHIKDKFGTNGNARYSQIYRTVYAKTLEAQMKEIDEVDVSKVPWHKFMMEFNKNEKQTDNVVDRAEACHPS